MAGSISLSLSQQFDSLGNPLGGGKLYFYQAGTTATPQNAYQDSALTVLHPNPITLDAAGRVPAFYLADGFIKIRLTDKNGVQQIAADNILVIGPSSGGGGGGGVDPTTILATGDMKFVYGTGSVTGFVRANGRTIGSATSGASERANADTQALYIFLWNADPNLVVSTGRGASGLSDFQANKTLSLPDFRGRALAGLDDMGNSAAGRLTSSYFGATATTLGASGGAESLTLTLAQLPTITSSGANTITVYANGNSANNVPYSTFSWTGDSYGGGPNQPTAHAFGSIFPTNTFSASNNISVTSSGTSGSAHRTVQPTILATFYLKL
jgi:hypothetical protein